MPDHPTAEVVAERYLTSPASIRRRPLGPVEALDTHSGRGAQVRIAFVPGDWGEHELGEAVSRWCGIGCAEICGILDFGRHGDRWFLVLPPTLGMPVERWRAMRRPAPADAARLTLAFGRLVERVHAAGFSPDEAELLDLAVGPGPTPFLERPLLGPPRPGGLPSPAGDGQRMLASVLEAATSAEEPLPDALDEWRTTAAQADFPTLSWCLDELERVGTVVREQAGAGDEPLGLAGLFDDDEGEGAGRVRAPGRGIVLPRPAMAVAMLVAAACAVALTFGPRALGGAVASAPEPAPAAPAIPAPVDAGPEPARAAPATTPRTVAAERPRRERPARVRRSTAATPPAAPAPAPGPAPVAPASPSAPPPDPGPGGGTSTPAPAPSGTPLPAPGDGPTPLPAPGGTSDLPAPAGAAPQPAISITTLTSSSPRSSASAQRSSGTRRVMSAASQSRSAAARASPAAS
jgi:hypothetical protein